MKIIFIIDQVYIHGGIERVLSVKANYLADMLGYEIHIVTTEQKENTPCYDFSKKVKFHDLGINYNRNKSYYHPINLIKLPKHILRIKKSIKNLKPDSIVVCSHSTDSYFLPFICKKIPKVKEFHYSKFFEDIRKKEPNNILREYYFKFTEYVEKSYDKIIVLNKDEERYYKSENTVVIPNPVSFFPTNISNQTNKIVIAAGRVAKVKRFEKLIDIWKGIYEEFPEWKLNIFGEGSVNYENQIKEKIEDLKMSNVIFMKGSTNKISDKMIDSSIYAMTSHTECFPLVLLEAQTCGLPIITFDCPTGPRNIVDENSGFLIKQDNDNDFIMKLKMLMLNKELRIKKGKCARENSKKFSVNSVLEKWDKMFNSLIRN